MSEPKPKRAKRRARPTMTGTAELVLAPQIRRFAARLYVGAAFAVMLLALGALGAVRELSVIEPMLAAQGVNAARSVVYELPVGAELHVPIEPRTDVLRFVIHAYGTADMTLTPHAARLVLELRGDRGTRTEELAADLPGVRSRVTAENPAVGVGDPTAIEVDVHDVGIGEIAVRLVGLNGADGMLVRAYRRERLNDAEAVFRETALDRGKKDELARWAWELGWDELTSSERLALLHARWKRIGAVRGASKDLRSTTIAVAPLRSHEPPPAREELLGRVALRGDERCAMLLRPGAQVRFVSDDVTTLRAVMRTASGAEESKSAAGQLEMGPFDDLRSIELGVTRDVVIEARALNVDLVEWPGWTNAWRATPATPVIIDSPDGDRVVRVSMRRPIARFDARVAHLAAKIELSGGGLASPVTQAFEADRPRSRVDRYQEFDGPDAPSERAAFFLALPRGSTARIMPADGAPLDVSLSELDESVPPLPMPTRPLDAPPPSITAETDDAQSAFVPRRPSNAHVFEPAAQKVVRTARWFAPVVARVSAGPAAPVALAHLKHTNVDRQERAGRAFDGISKPFDIEAEPRRPLFVPVVAASDEPTKLIVRVERDPIAGRPIPALYTRWTLPRTMEIGPSELRATFVIGDDVPARAKLRLRIVAESPPARGKHALVLLPWTSTRAVGPRWLAGAFEE